MRGSAVIVLWLWSVTAYGAEQEQACPELFGDADAHERHRARRESLLRYIDPAEPYVAVALFEHREVPTPLRILGVELLAVDPEAGKAEVELDAASAGVDCADGRYEIEVDDSLGPNASVLAIFDDVVLIEHDGQLGYLSAGGPGPRWSLAWVSSWSIAPYRRGAVTTAVRAPQPPRRR